MSEKRRLSHSQNFIKRPELVRELLDLSEITPDDLVVEIGPGKGIITRELLKRAGRVIAIEKDILLANSLSSQIKEKQFTLVVGDFLTWQFPHEEFKVFSNIPFNYTADIVNKLTRSPHPPVDSFLILQEAAAFRFAGQPYTKESQISILLAIDFDITIIRTIALSNFEPRPKTNIVFTRIHKRTNPLISRELSTDFRDFVIYGYNQWQPTILGAFRNIFSSEQRAKLVKAQNLEALKPSDLSVNQWISIFQVYSKYVSESKKRMVRGSEQRLVAQQKKIEKQHRTRKH